MHEPNLLQTFSFQQFWNWLPNFLPYVPFLCDTCAFPLVVDWPQSSTSSYCFGHFSWSRIQFTRVVMLLLLLIASVWFIVVVLKQEDMFISIPHSTLAYMCHILPNTRTQGYQLMWFSFAAPLFCQHNAVCLCGPIFPFFLLADWAHA